MQYTHSLRILSLVIMGIIFSIPVTQATASSQKDNAVITTLFSQTKPQCIGRYIIDVPQSFYNQSNNMIFIDDFRIESQFLYPPAFKQRIRLREKELNDEINKPGNDLKDAPFIKEQIQLPEGKGIIFDRNISGQDDLGRILEAHVYTDMMAFTITTEILDLSDPKYIDRKKTYIDAGFSEAKMNDKSAKLAAMKSLISRLSGRKDESIPTEKGLCIPNGFIKDDGGKHQEKVSLTYENDELIFGVETDNTMVGSRDTLLSRSANVSLAIKESNQQTIKKGELAINGIPSQEWLVTGIQESNRMNGQFPLYKFVLFSNESIATQSKPWLSFGLNNVDKNSHYNQQQMVEIWDKIVNSLRYRPNAF
nr:T6SS immunity protein Tli4 family protein [uncultured Moellerella sp.]